MTKRQGDGLNDLERLLLQLAMFNAGIVPIENVEHDMRRALQQLAPDEAKRLKRKFRKMWRRAACRSDNGASDAMKRKLGIGKKTPTREERNQRKKLVFDELRRSFVAPAIEEMTSQAQSRRKRNERN